MKAMALLIAFLVTMPALASTPPIDAAAETKLFTGRRIDIDFRNGEIHNILRLLSDAGQVNITTSADVKGRMTILLKGAPWDEVLDVVARRASLTYERAGNTIYVRAARK
jgi:type IV pilus assembly protein PilQ